MTLRAKRKEGAAVTIQKHARGYTCHTLMKRKRAAAVSIQKRARGLTCRAAVKKQRAAAIDIQRRARGMTCRKTVKQKHDKLLALANSPARLPLLGLLGNVSAQGSPLPETVATLPILNDDDMLSLERAAATAAAQATWGKRSIAYRAEGRAKLSVAPLCRTSLCLLCAAAVTAL